MARRGIAHGCELGKVGWVVERTSAWLHQLKWLRTRYERPADLHQGLPELSCSHICLHRLRTSPPHGLVDRVQSVDVTVHEVSRSPNPFPTTPSP